MNTKRLVFSAVVLIVSTGGCSIINRFEDYDRTEGGAGGIGTHDRSGALGSAAGASGAQNKPATGGEPGGDAGGEGHSSATECGPGTILCDGLCVAINGTNCGQCGNACGEGEACVNAECSCMAPYIDCNGDCVDINTNPAHCGQCENSCADPEPLCSEGTCTSTCGEGETACDGACVDLETTEAHCGSCAVSCGPDQTCESGECACNSPLVDCGGTCVDLELDAAHCGGCGVECESGQCSWSSCIGVGTGGAGGSSSVGTDSGGTATGGEAQAGAGTMPGGDGGVGGEGGFAGDAGNEGSDTGGSATGGQATGGAATAGAPTGGTATGGAETGGATTSGGSGGTTSFCSVPADCGNEDSVHCECFLQDASCLLRAKDADGDNHGDELCAADAIADDCDDSRATVYPGRLEVCDGLDNDCNGLADLDDGLTLYGSFVDLIANAESPFLDWSPETLRYGIVWQDETSATVDSVIHFSLLASDGSMVGSPATVSRGGQTGLIDRASVRAFAWGAGDSAQTFGEFGLVYRFVMTDAAVDNMYFQRIGSGGGLLGSELLLSSTEGISSVAAARVPGGDWFVFWSAAGVAWGAQISGDGELIDQDSVGNGGMTAIASAGQVAAAHADSSLSTTSLQHFTDSLASTPVAEIVALSTTVHMGGTDTHYGLAWGSQFREFSLGGVPTCNATNLPSAENGGSAFGVAPFRDGWLIGYTETILYTSADYPDLIRVGADCRPQGTLMRLEDGQAYHSPFRLAKGGGGYAVAWNVSSSGADPVVRLRVLGPNLCDAPE